MILAGPATAQFIPRMSHNRVVSGHDMLSPNYHARNIDIWRFYHTPDEDGHKQWLVRTNHVDYVIFGPFEGQTVTPREHPWLELVHVDRDTRVFRVDRDKM